MKSRRKPGNSCCTTPYNCSIYSDDFTADRTGTDYTGTGSYTGFSGSISTSGTGKLIANTATPTGHGHASIQGKVSANGGSFYLDGAYQDANNYTRVEIVINGASSTMKTYKTVGGITTQIGPTIVFSGALNTYYALDLCWDDTAVYSHSSAGDCFAQSGAFTPTGGNAGFGATPGSGTVTFRNFIFVQTMQDDPSCPDCNSTVTTCDDCLDGKIPDLIKGTVSGMGAVTGGLCAEGGFCNFLDGSWVMCGGGCGWGMSTPTCLSFTGTNPALCNTPTFIPCVGDESDIVLSRSAAIGVSGGRLLAFGTLSLSGTPILCSPRTIEFSADLGAATPGEVDCVGLLRTGFSMPVTSVHNGCGIPASDPLMCGANLAAFAGVMMTVRAI